MLLSVIIPTCNRNDLLDKCLDQLQYDVQGLSRSDYEVIVTDDSKESLARDFIKVNFPWVQWVEGPKRGPAANRNNGAKQAKGEWLVFLDDDCEPDSKLLGIYKETIETKQKLKVIEGAIKSDREKLRFDEEAPLNECGGNLWSCNFAIKKDIFISLSGFDEEFPFAAVEDVDLHYRIKKAGIGILFQPLAFVLHPWRIQKKMNWVTKKRFESLIYFLNKYPELIPKYRPHYFLRIAFDDSIYILKNIYRFRCKGLIPFMEKILLHIYFSFVIVYKTIFIWRN